VDYMSAFCRTHGLAHCFRTMVGAIEAAAVVMSTSTTEADSSLVLCRTGAIIAACLAILKFCVDSGKASREDISAAISGESDTRVGAGDQGTRQASAVRIASVFVHVLRGAALREHGIGSVAGLLSPAVMARVESSGSDTATADTGGLVASALAAEASARAVCVGDDNVATLMSGHSIEGLELLLGTCDPADSAAATSA